MERLRLALAYEEAIRQADEGNHDAAERTLREASRSAHRSATAAGQGSAAAQALLDHAARLESLADQVKEAGDAVYGAGGPGGRLFAAESPPGSGSLPARAVRKEMRRLAEQSRRGREQG